MNDVESWFEQGTKHPGLSRFADLRSEYIGDLEDTLAAFEQALRLKPGWLAASGRLEVVQRELAAAAADT